MNKIKLILALVAVAALLFTGCSKAQESAESAEKNTAAAKATEKADKQTAENQTDSKIGKMSVEQLASAIKAGECTVFDANTAQVRSEFGSIPEAKLLSHYKEYKLDELPAKKSAKLVFYCSNEQCTASHRAAERALLAGYSDVHILPAGIAGWKKAGMKTEALQ